MTDLELRTADHTEVRDCTPDPGIEHDYRAHETTQHGKRHTVWRCVWCHAVSCGDWRETDPCIEPYHHRVPHRTRRGVTWPIGGTRP